MCHRTMVSYVLSASVPLRCHLSLRNIIPALCSLLRSLSSREALSLQREDKPARNRYTSRLNFKVASEKVTTSNDVFTWQHIQYTVPVSSGERRLLDDVSGYVAPGKLTALMGESGAGKVCHLSCLWSSRSTFHHRRRYCCYRKAVCQWAAPSCGLPAQTLVNHGFV